MAISQVVTFGYGNGTLTTTIANVVTMGFTPLVVASPLTTANQRASAIHLALPFRGYYSQPDGTIGAGDRAVAALMYWGAGGEEVIVAVPTMDLVNETWTYPQVILELWGGPDVAGSVDATDSTAGKRSSGVHLALPFRTICPRPDGSFNAGDRATISKMYYGNSLTVASSAHASVVNETWEYPHATGENWRFN